MEFSEYNVSYLNYVYWFCTAYVGLKISLAIWTLVKDYVLTIFQEHNFKQYGQWAVITGSTDGIGRGFALELSKRGLDVCLISRNEEKLKNTAKEIEGKYKVQTKYIVADFTSPDVYTHIKDNLTDLDVGILVNNVGIAADNVEAFSRHSEQLIKDYLNVDVLSLTMMTSLVLPCMLKKKRGLILNMSSTLGILTMPYLSLYCSCKAYVNMFGSCLSYELKKHNIQVTTLTPGMIDTKLLRRFDSVTKWANYYTPFGVLTVPQFVKNALRTISSGSYINCGYIMFELYQALISSIPLGIISELLLFIRKLSKKQS